MTHTDLRTLTPDPAKFIRQGRGFVDWKFSQVCQYLGYHAAVEYAQAMRRWHDYSSKYQGCLLATTYEAYLQAEKQEQQSHTTAQKSPLEGGAGR